MCGLARLALLVGARPETYPEERLLRQVLLALDLHLDLLWHVRDQRVQQPAEEEQHVLHISVPLRAQTCAMIGTELNSEPM